MKPTSPDIQAVIDYSAAHITATPKVPMVYFIEAPSIKLIKIGRTQDVKKRISELQVGSPVPLRLLGVVPGDSAMEKQIQDKFKHLRKHGEWFRESVQLLEYIGVVLEKIKTATRKEGH